MEKAIQRNNKVKIFSPDTTIGAFLCTLLLAVTEIPIFEL